MRHTLIHRAALLALIAAATTACSNEITDAESSNPTGNGDGGKIITVTATQQAGEANGQQQADQPQTRLDYGFPDGGAVTVTWKKGDKFYVNNDANWVTYTNLSATASNFKPFTLQGDGGSKTGSFSGTLPGGTTNDTKLYALYGNADKMYASSGQTIILYYTGQQQNANDDKAHLADYDFMTASPIYQAGQKTAFNFTHQGAMMKFTLTMPTAGITVKELRLAATSLSVDGSTLAPFCMNPVWKAADNTLESSSTTTAYVNLRLGNSEGITISGTTLTAYMMVASTTLTAANNPIDGKNMMLLVTTKDNKIYGAQLTGAEIKQGHYYTVTATLSKTFEEGVGTEESPYEIHDDGQLRNMAILANSKLENANQKNFQSAHYKLTADIDLKNQEWTPIGTNTNTFFGTLTGAKEGGGNYEIKNLSIKNSYNSTSYLPLGLFGQLYGNVSNVTVSGNISPTITGATAVYAGGIAGINTGTTLVTNCISNCTINIPSTSPVCAGGIIGHTQAQTTTLTNCSNTGTITPSTNPQKGLYAGGIIGYFKAFDASSTFTLTLNGYSNTGTPAVIGYYYFGTNTKSKIEIRQTKDTDPLVVLNSGSGSYPLNTSGGAGQYPDDGDMFGTGTATN